MRVIAGRHGGRRLRAPAGAATRPTPERVREALFSILGARVEGARVLDLYAGSGALGIEALSRGAASATFVDDAPAALQALQANLDSLHEEAEVVRADALRWLHGASRRARQYDLVLLDPPYRRAPALGPALGAALPAVLAGGALVVAESDRRAPLELGIPVIDDRRYGDTRIRIHGS
jgi:16S rRNA (guanine(966)-N(2))-methyltransferase RsmD